MNDEKALFEAILFAEDVVYWARRYIETPTPDILKILQAAMEEFEENKP